MGASPYRRSFAADPALCDRIFDLLDTWLPALSSLRRRAEQLDWRWEDVSTPFVHEREGQVVAHVGLLESRLVCLGRERRVGGIHAVCTHASLRRRGLYRELMQEVLADCDARYETVKLSTQHPEYYEPFGFRVVPEHRFAVAVESEVGVATANDAAAPGRGGGFRALDPRRPEDLVCLERLLRTRAPGSRALAALDPDVFKFNLPAFGETTLRYCAALDLLAVVANDGATLEVYDVAAPRYPSFEAFVAQLAPRPERVVFYFRPDAFGVEGRPEAHRWDSDVLMVRGPLPFEGSEGPLPPVMLSPLSRH